MDFAMPDGPTMSQAEFAMFFTRPDEPTMRNCRHCEEWLECHPWGDGPHFYCDACWDWWEAFQGMWALHSVLMLQQSSHSNIQAICAAPFGLLIGRFL